jgi:IS1 family transposase
LLFSTKAIMNKLPNQIRAQILSMLVEGSSLRSISRITGVSINTVTKLLVDAGKVCSDFHDENVKGVISKSIQCDEIWSFCYAKERNVKGAVAAPEGSGDVWTWTAIDSDTKLIATWLVGSRDTYAATMFLRDLRSRLVGNPQITTDGHKAYPQAMAQAFGTEIDYAQLIKVFGPTPAGKDNRYSPPSVIGTEIKVVSGNPDTDHINTSFVERQNLTMRMSMRRYTRLTNAFSKKYENHCHALALYFFHYNWIRIHKTLRVTPAMASNLTTTLMSWETIIELMDHAEQKAIVAKRWAKAKELP